MTESDNRHGTCLTCFYSQKVNPDDYTTLGAQCDFECHRYPPHDNIASMNDNDIFNLQSSFPMVQAFEWCGEYKFEYADMCRI